MAKLPRHRCEGGEPFLHEHEAAPGRFNEIGAPRDGALVAIDADHAAIGRRQDRARVAARTERRVDIDAAVAHREKLDCAGTEHGNVTG